MITVVTRKEIIRRLEEVEREIAELKKALEAECLVPATKPTQAFLEKCGGWEDTRRPEEIIADIYLSRESSDRAASLFNQGG